MSITWHLKFTGANNNQPILVAGPHESRSPSPKPVPFQCSVARRVVEPVLSCAQRPVDEINIDQPLAGQFAQRQKSHGEFLMLYIAILDTLYKEYLGREIVRIILINWQYPQSPKNQRWQGEWPNQTIKTHPNPPHLGASYKLLHSGIQLSLGRRTLGVPN